MKNKIINWKFTLIFFASFMTIRLILFYCVDWQITNITVIISIVMSLIFGVIERDRR